MNRSFRKTSVAASTFLSGKARGDHRFRGGCRKSFTLTEALLVLALVTICASVAWVSLERPLANQRLHSAGDAIRTEWCQARVAAMRSGHTYAFTYTVGGIRYHLRREEGAPSSFGTSDDDTKSSADGTSSLPQDKSLPEGILFAGDDGGGGLTASDQDSTSTLQESSSWSDPILFFPDGSTSDARLVLASGRHASIQLSLRGVTGAVTVGELASVAQ